MEIEFFFSVPVPVVLPPIISIIILLVESKMNWNWWFCPLALGTVGNTAQSLVFFLTNRLSRVQALQNVARDPLLPFAMQ